MKSRDGALGKWLCLQRVKYNSGRLDPNIAQQLEEIGLEWSQWENMYQQLREYKEQHGNCLVPRREEFKRLNRWVTTQRQNYKIPGRLNQEKLDKLNGIGFVWCAGERGPRRKKEEEVVEVGAEDIQTEPCSPAIVATAPEGSEDNPIVLD